MVYSKEATMPCPGGKGKIHSKAQQRFLFAAANRGEIPEEEVKRMAHKSGNLKRLPEHAKKAMLALVEKQAGKLTIVGRKRIKPSKFGLPGKGEGPEGTGHGSYPMNDIAHARNAIARAKQQLEAGNLSQAEYEQIVSKAYRLYPGLRKRKVEREGKEGLEEQVKGSSIFSRFFSEE